MAAADSSDEYDDDDLAAEIDIYFTTFFMQMDRQNNYYASPTAAKLEEFNHHETILQRSVQQLNVHSQRILETFKSQVGYVDVMETFVQKKQLLDTVSCNHGLLLHQASKPHIETQLGELPLSPRDRDAYYDSPLLGGSDLDVAGQAGPARGVADT